MTDYQANQPLPLHGSCNTRELGGYPTAHGGQTATHRLLRSDALSRLTVSDQQFLYEYGLRTVIDLRSPRECDKAPCALIDFKDIAYINLPMLDRIQSDGLQGTLPDTIGETYLNLLDLAQTMLRDVLRAVLAAPVGSTVLFNCTAGKDRTGIVAMLLLLNAGVAVPQVLADYQVSAANMQPVFDRQKAEMDKLGLKWPEKLLCSDPEHMELAINHMNSQYSGIKAYLKLIGLCEEEIAALADVLLD